MKHVKLFESFGPQRGLGEIELNAGIGMVVYDIMDNEKIREMYTQFYPNGEITFEEFLTEMSTPGVYGEGEYGGPWEVIEIDTNFSGFLDKGRYFGMIYRF
jgi:hypothetical protein